MTYERKYMPVREFCEVVSMKRSTVYKLIGEKRIPCAQVGGIARIPMSYLRRLEEGAYENGDSDGRQIRGRQHRRDA